MIVALDLEGTLIDAELFPALGEKAGKKAILDDITCRAMRGDLDFSSSLFMRTNIIKGMSIRVAQKTAQSLPLTKGAEETVSRIKQLGATPIILTGGFDILANRAAYLLDIEYVCCNRFMIENGRISGVLGPVITGEDKAEKLLGLAKWLGVKPSDCVSVGDGANDIEMMRATGLSIAFNGRKKVREAATIAIDGKDLRSILPAVEEFASKAMHMESQLVNLIR